MTVLMLDRPALHHAATWSPDLVRARLVEAFEIEARLPEPKGPSRGNASAWPTMSREFEDLVGWSTEAREEYWHHMARAKGVHPYEVTRRDEAMAWLEDTSTVSRRAAMPERLGSLHGDGPIVCQGTEDQALV